MAVVLHVWEEIVYGLGLVFMIILISWVTAELSHRYRKMRRKQKNKPESIKLLMDRCQSSRTMETVLLHECECKTQN
ncbi:Oidioi.mRNA.OKI2018_I69.chr2.g4664.t1.cds [Oikopleura dioica]|uniref:Oidioi.mRNA.OKI2018_I69.chr2.g4664.t1.cds n=1 Tax=Oikopleura dioica TaxID=34765 RepID=A0ABN7T2C3_OIKDI|nr:Oidioi.mRNA.OKI2018_I69.chr2.g4664.t1.cds [Oikopleura dioica]